MSKNNKNDMIIEHLLDIKEQLGNHTGLIKGMHEKQDYTNGRINRMEDRVNVLEDKTTKNGTKIAMFVSIIAAVWATFETIIKAKLGL